MPFCPICHAEFREGFTHCNSCDVDLVQELPQELDLSEDSIREKLLGKELVIVTRGTLDVVKETRDFLALHRIASIIVDDKESPKVKGMPPRVALAASSEEIDDVSKLLGERFHQMVQTEGFSPDKKIEYNICPACNNRIPDNVEECPECGLFIGKV